MKKIGIIFATLMLTACAATDDRDGHRKHSPITDFIEVNELTEVNEVRTLDQLNSRTVDDKFIVVSTRREEFLLEYYTRCQRRFDGAVEPDIRRDPRVLLAGADTFRGCRIKALYEITPEQAEEVIEIARAARD